MNLSLVTDFLSELCSCARAFFSKLVGTFTLGESALLSSSGELAFVEALMDAGSRLAAKHRYDLAGRGSEYRGWDHAARTREI